MPPPLPLTADVQQFVRTLRRSRLLPDDRVYALVAAATDKSRQNLDLFAEALVEDQSLTHFQVAKLRQGTWQGLALGPYHVLAPLGRGGMSIVYLARDTRKVGAANTHGGRADATLVALKVLPPKRARAEDRTLARFLREMDICRRVSHPHLTKTFEAGEFDGVYYIAMEYIRGQSLWRYVADHGPISASRAARLFAEIADGLAYAHGVGLIHRDLKPSNVMVTPNGHAKILDLGLALAVDEELPTDKRIVGGRGYVVGTMDYIAPEQVTDPSRVDGRADLYALGCSMYFALTGRPPFPGGTSTEKMRRQRTAIAEPIADFNPTIPAAFVRVVERLMEKSPARRFPDAAAVRTALQPWTVGDPETPLDVDPDQTEAEAVSELERTQGPTESFFESIPVAVFRDRAKRYSADSGSATPPAGTRTRRRLPFWPLFAVAAIAVMVIGAGLVWGLLRLVNQ